MQQLKDQAVLILGLGTSGLAMARWCARCGAGVTVADTRAAPPQLLALQRELPAVRFVCAALDAALLRAFPDDKNLHRWLKVAAERVAFQGLPARICWFGYGDREKAGIENRVPWCKERCFLQSCKYLRSPLLQHVLKQTRVWGRPWHRAARCIKGFVRFCPWPLQTAAW